MLSHSPAKYQYDDPAPLGNSNRRSNSVFDQLSYTTRQHLQGRVEETPINAVKYHSTMQVSPQLSLQKENQPLPAHPLSFQAKMRFQTSKVVTQNEALKDQMATQKQKYEAEIAKLKKNITFKDQLLDQCEKEINNLKGTYHTLLAYFDKIKHYDSPSTNTFQTAPPPDPKPQKKPPKQQKAKIDKQKNEAGLIPLSMMNKTLPRSSSSCSSNRKLTHGLIRPGM